MALPVGVTTFTLNFGKPTDFIGNNLGQRVEVTPSHELVWEATGDPLKAIVATATAASGEQGSVTLPSPYQAGFLDLNGNEITAFWYTVKSWALDSRGQKAGGVVTRKVQPAEGTTLVDLELVPADTVVGPVGSVVPPAVTSVNGATGAITVATAEQGELADSAYQKPETGVPASDLEDAVQTSLGLADSAYQKPETGVPSSDLEDAVQTSLGLADGAAQKDQNLNDVADKAAARTNLDVFSKAETNAAYAPSMRIQWLSPVTKMIFDKAYTAWPAGCLIVDEARGVIGQLYTAGLSHAEDAGAAEKAVRSRRMGVRAGVVGNFVEVSDLTSSNKDSEVNAAFRAPNGDWIALIRRASNTTWGIPDSYVINRSADGGITWATGVQISDGSNNLLPAHIANPLVTSSGSVICSYVSAYDGACFVLRTTAVNAGNPWRRYGSGGADTAISGLAGALEGSFVQIGDGTIISLWRVAMDADYANIDVPKFSISTDDGMTWSAAANADIHTMTNNNAAMIYNPASDTVEAVVGDRYGLGDGCGSLWHYSTPAAQAKLGKFGTPRRIYKASGSHRDFGYPALGVLSDGTVILRFYDRVNGTADTAAIYEMRGQLATA